MIRTSVLVTVFALALAGCATNPLSGGASAPSEIRSGDDEWYCFDWMAEAPYAPVFHVRDTESSLGPYAEKTKTLTLADLVKMHGHPCDGLVTEACALSLGLKHLYPDGVIDRTIPAGYATIHRVTVMCGISDRRARALRHSED
jgi:hypothetical protein